MSRRTENEAWHAGFTACANEHMKQRHDPEYPITRTVPERYRWTQDYNETLISQAGGDGDNADIIALLVGLAGEPVRFTNVPMHRVHTAIAVLNGDGEDALPAGYESLAHKLAANKMYGDHASRTRDFTSEELFGQQKGKETNYGTYVYSCFECGAVVDSRAKHVTWHNKTLP